MLPITIHLPLWLCVKVNTGQLGAHVTVSGTSTHLVRPRHHRPGTSVCVCVCMCVCVCVCVCGCTFFFPALQNGNRCHKRRSIISLFRFLPQSKGRGSGFPFSFSVPVGSSHDGAAAGPIIHLHLALACSPRTPFTLDNLYLRHFNDHLPWFM